RAYSKREYRELLDGYGWDKGSSEERRALKLAEHFQDFAHRPHALIQIPVTTLLRLCSEKYKPIIEELNQLDEDDITCDRVLKLIKDRQEQLKKEKESELPENLQYGVEIAGVNATRSFPLCTKMTSRREY
ncbi:MAG: hypothetical protein HC903_31220, partial [Methylacidiphilales bacterium]|nr:hypothetical protein [Candidatus Methylacidiphilales bacterium]